MVEVRTCLLPQIGIVCLSTGFAFVQECASSTEGIDPLSCDGGSSPLLLHGKHEAGCNGAEPSGTSDHKVLPILLGGPQNDQHIFAGVVLKVVRGAIRDCLRIA